jgi:hypothetical protein
VATFENEFYVATRNYLFQFDATSWGWIHLLVGLIVAFAGWGLLSGRTWARVVGITLAVVSAITNFLFIPYYPFWALLIITLDVFVIWRSPPTAATSTTPQSERGAGPAPRPAGAGGLASGWRLRLRRNAVAAVQLVGTLGLE